MIYGNTTAELKRIILAGLIIGLLGFIVFVIGTAVDGGLSLEKVFSYSLIVVVPPTVLGVAMVPSLLFHIRVKDGWIQHVFLDRMVLSEHPPR